GLVGGDVVPAELTLPNGQQEQRAPQGGKGLEPEGARPAREQRAGQLLACAPTVDGDCGERAQIAERAPVGLEEVHGAPRVRREGLSRRGQGRGTARDRRHQGETTEKPSSAHPSRGEGWLSWSRSWSGRRRSRDRAGASAPTRPGRPR